MTRNQLNITVGSDVILNVTLVHEEETLIPALIDNLDANLISGLGTRTALETGLGADYITIAIPWVEGRLAGCYSLEVKGSINGLAWAAIGKGLIRYTNSTEAGAESVTVEADAYDVTMDAGYHWTDSPIAAVHVSVDDEYGTPSADVTYQQRVLGLDFHNLKGNGITEIDVDEQVGDEAVNTVTIKTDKDPEGTELQVRNGSRGNGISSSSEELSPEDGGTNTFTFTDDDGTEHVLHTKNGTKGTKGDSVIVGQGDLPLTHELGQSYEKAMSQKGVTDAVLDLLDGKVVLGIIDISGVEQVNYTINNDINKWKQNTGWYSKFVPVIAGMKYRVTSPQDTGTQFAFMTSDSVSLNQTVSTYAQGISAVTILQSSESSDIMTAPADAMYLYIVSGKPNVANVAVVIETEKENPLVNIDEIEQKIISFDRNINIGSIQRISVIIDGNSNKWATGTGWYSKFVPVVAGKKYNIVVGEDENIDNNVIYTFLTSDNYTLNSSVTTYANGYAFISRIGESDKNRIVTAPSNAQYLYVITEKGNGDIGLQIYEENTSLIDTIQERMGTPMTVSEVGGNGVFGTLQDAIDACEDDDTCELMIEGTIHVQSTVTIPHGKKVIIKGGKILGSMQSLGLSRNDKNGIAKVYIGDLKPQWLMADGVMRYPASTPRDYCYVSAVTCSGSSGTDVTATITIPVDDAVKLAESDTTDVWITILHEWRGIKLRINSINTSTGVITCVYYHNKGTYLSFAGNKRIIVENVSIEGSSMNNGNDTFANDTFYYSDGWLYYKYDQSSQKPDLEIPCTETVITSDGTLEMHNVEIACTSHVFDDIMGEGNGYRSFQSCFVINGAVEIHGKADITDCRFYGTTNNSIVVKNGSYDVNIINCQFDEIGGNALMVGNLNYAEYMAEEISSYIPNNPPVNINIIGNSIHHPGRIYEEASAIVITYCQYFRISSNVISDTYYTGISTGCDWGANQQMNVGGIVEGNILKNIGVGGCALVDGAAIYNLGNERGMVVRYNIITQVYGGPEKDSTLAAIFLDQSSANITFEKNFIYDASNFIFINQGGDGLSINNNVFAFPKYRVTSRNLNKASAITGNIFVWDGNILGTQTTTGTYVGNLYWRYDETLSSVPFDASAVIGDPNFRDKDNYDFQVIDDEYTSEINFENFTPLTPSRELVRKASNNPEEEAMLMEWIESWNA